MFWPCMVAYTDEQLGNVLTLHQLAVQVLL